MAEIIQIVGQSGSGKTSCFRNMPWEHTVYFNIESKRLEFVVPEKYRGRVITPTTDGSFSGAAPPVFTMWEQMWTEALDKYKPAYVVIDSLTRFTNAVLVQCETAYVGFKIFGEHNKLVAAWMERFKRSLPRFILMAAIDETIDTIGLNGQDTKGRRVYVSGKELEGKMEATANGVLYTYVDVKPDGSYAYQLLTTPRKGHSIKWNHNLAPLPPIIDNDVMVAIAALEKGLGYPPLTAVA